MSDLPLLIQRPPTEELQTHFTNVVETKKSLHKLRNVEQFIGWEEELMEAIDVLDRIEAKIQDTLVDRLGREGVRELLLGEMRLRDMTPER